MPGTAQGSTQSAGPDAGLHCAAGEEGQKDRGKGETKCVCALQHWRLTAGGRDGGE